MLGKCMEKIQYHVQNKEETSHEVSSFVLYEDAHFELLQFFRSG